MGWKWNATPECAALRDRWRECQRRYRERIQGMILAGMRQVDIVEALQLTSNRIVTQHKRQLGVPVAKRHNWDDKHDIIRRLFARGYTVPEVAEHFGVTTACMRTAIDRAGIPVPRCQSRADVAARNIVRAKRGLPPLKPLVERIAEGKRRKHEVG
jgi:transposase-like protein